MASRPKRVGMVSILLLLAGSCKSSTSPDAGNPPRDGSSPGGTDAAADAAKDAAIPD